MNIKELKELIKDEPDDREVYLSSDEEGNEFHKAVDVSHMIIDKSGLNFDASWNFEDAELDSEEEWEQYKKDHPQALVIWP